MDRDLSRSALAETACRGERAAARRRVGALLLAAIGPVRADTLAAVEIADLAGNGWTGRDLSLQVQRSTADGRIRLRLRAAVLALGEEPPLRDIELRCDKGSYADGRFDCRDGRLAFLHPELGEQQLDWQGHYASPEDLRLEFAGLRLAGSKIAGTFEGGGDGWRATARGWGLRIARLPRLSLPDGWTLTGALAATVEARGGEGGLERLRLDLTTADVRYSDAAGLQVGEGLGFDLGLDVRPTDGAWRFDADGTLKTGQLYSDPVFVEIKERPIELGAAGTLDANTERLTLSRAALKRGQTWQASGTAGLRLSPLAWRSMAATIEVGDWARVFPTFIQPFLIGTAGDDLQMSGAASVEIALDGDGPTALDLALRQTGIEDRRGRFGFDRLNGDLHWRRGGPPERSRLELGTGHLYQIPFGAFTVEALLQGGDLRLLEPVRMPTLGGRFDLQSLRLSGLLEPPVEWRTSARLRQLSLEELTRRLEWPPFNGSLNADLPNLRFEQGAIRADGELLFDVFGGRVRLGGLRIRDLLGIAPVLEGRVVLRDLDLRQLTQAFSFGRIEGRLAGEVEDLQLVAWQPNRFRLHLYTPADDDSRKRISQKAVDNLTELGSGVPAGLSRTFLGLFDEFSYGRIDIRIDLDGNQARIDGIERPEGGYYLVEGSGLPRIDVVGRNRRVAWKELVERLKNIQLEGAQVVPQ